MVLQDWTTAVADSWTIVWDRFVNFLPNLIGAIIILVVGWIFGLVIEMVIDRFFRVIGLQTLFEKARIDEVLKKGSIEKDTTTLLAASGKWIIYLVTFIAAANTLKLPDVAAFLDKILAYVPSVAAAAAILLIGLVLAHFLANVVKGAMLAAGFGLSDAVSSVTRYAIIIFTFMAALSQLGIAQYFLSTIFIGVVAFLAIAGGLAFGLGGQGVAKDILEKIHKEMK